MDTMNTAIITRINEILKEKNITLCDLALKGGLTPSTAYELMKGRTKVPKVITISKLCDGAGITLSEFFDKEYFNNYFEE